jgi:hypothetical protein
MIKEGWSIIFITRSWLKHCANIWGKSDTTIFNLSFASCCLYELGIWECHLHNNFNSSFISLAVTCIEWLKHVAAREIKELLKTVAKTAFPYS